MKSPILEYKPKPTFRTQYEKQKYWEGEQKKWVEGIGDIPGTLYHKTQEQKIKDRDLGSIFRPICRDVDLLIHQEIASCRKAGEALVVIKGRGVGLSAEMGCLANYFMKVYPGTTTLLTSQAQPKISSLFSEKVAVTYDNYDDDIKPVEINRNETKSSCYLRTEQLFLNEEEKEQLNMSKILCRETSESDKSTSAFSGEGAIFGAYDEIFLHQRREKLIRSSTSCFVNQKTRITTGFLLMGGTVEDGLTNHQLGDLQILINEIQEKGRLATMKARLLFIPSWMGAFMTNGWSDEKKGREWWEKEVEELSKLGDSAALRAFKMNNPMSLDDIFQLASGTRWEEDVSEKIKLQYKNVVKSNIPISQCKLVELKGQVETSMDKKGTIFILENPKPGIQYHLCVDGVATGSKSGEKEGSNVAGTIVKLFDPSGDSYAPVCIYTERPLTVEQSYISLVNQARYYNKYGGMKGIMAEANAGTSDHFGAFLRKMGHEKWIMQRQDLSGKGYSNTQKDFQYRTNEVRDFQMRQANIFIRKYAQVLKMIPLLLDMMTPESQNADILDSWLMFFVAAGVNFDKPYVPPKIKAPRQIRVISQDSSGKTFVEWKTV